MTADDEVPLAEHEDRLKRGRSAPCPDPPEGCGAQPPNPCRQPDGSPTTTHAARWGAWYAAHPEASAS